MSALSLYILCHNRPDDARQAIRSVLAQTDQEFTLTVSDNSSDDRVEQMVRQDFPAVNYVRRRPMLAALEHFNRCIEEAQGTHFCLFHDDDLMAPDFVQEVKAAIQAYPQAIAFGCNAYIESLGKRQPRLAILSGRRYELITSPRQLAARYFARYQSGIAPFPGYVYQRASVGTTRFHPDEGKYSDVTWLLRLAGAGLTVWISKPLMTYRLHGGNDGSIESRRDRLRFLSYLKQQRRELGAGILQDYRCSFVYKPMILKSAVTSHPVRQSTAARFLRHYRWRRYARLDTYRALLRRALVKWTSRS
jgi:GT2 family glycosyltransferase